MNQLAGNVIYLFKAILLYLTLLIQYTIIV